MIIHWWASWLNDIDVRIANIVYDPHSRLAIGEGSDLGMQ
jgi:hypothetical protein